MSERFEMRLSKDLAERIDEARGGAPRATWIKLCIEATLGNGPAAVLSPAQVEAVRQRAVEVPAVLDAVAPEPSSGKGKASRPMAPAHSPTCKCGVCKPVKR